MRRSPTPGRGFRHRAALRHPHFGLLQGRRLVPANRCVQLLLSETV